MNHDKEIEKRRYDARALEEAGYSKDLKVAKWHLHAIECYYKAIRKHVTKEHRVLELGAGTGNHSSVVLSTRASLVATDISEKSIYVLGKRFIHFDNLKTSIEDIEKLSFKNNEFDFVISSGVLSYGENILVLNEIYRVLKPHGMYIFLDSLNHNPIYRINRRIHVIKGSRPRSTVRNMPTLSLLNKFEEKFGKMEVSFYGSLIWLAPIFSIFLGEEITARIIRKFDEIINPKKSAFKVVCLVQKLS